MTWHKVYEDTRTVLYYCNYWHNGTGYQFTRTVIKYGKMAGEIYRARHLDKWQQLARASTLRELLIELKISSLPQLLFT